jgi:nucleoside-diphosphate-sugar epimerase
LAARALALGQHGAIPCPEHLPLKVLVTGASGFIGTHLVPLLVARGHHVMAASRKPVDIAGVTWRLSPELGSGSDWSRVLQGAEAVVHLAGRAQTGPDSEVEKGICRRINAEGTARLAHQAAESGARRFLFLSSVHAVAEESDQIITDATAPRPVSAYGLSKLAAEEALRSELGAGACAWTILRSCAVYGPGNVSNFSRLLKLVATGLPLPLASVNNRRSFIYVETLVDLIAASLEAPKALGKTYLPSDGEDVSTPELIRAIARANPGVEHGAGSMEHGAGIDAGGRGKIGDGPATRHTSHVTRHYPRLFPFSEGVLRGIGSLPGLGALRKLTSSLYVDSEPLRRDLGWRPPFTMEEGLRRALSSRRNLD